MPMIEPMIQEFQYEMGSTRALLERLPDAAWDWKPHDKSMTLGELASHLVESVAWTLHVMEKDVFELDTQTWKPYRAACRAELLAAFDENAQIALAAMDGAPDAHLMKPWKMVIGGETAMEMPRAAILRTFLISHMIHHRGQLTVYARLRDVALPSIYGPTADEPAM